MATSTRYHNTFHLLLLLVVLAKAQQGVLVNGNNHLPDCAQDCLLLNQAAQACSASGGTATAAEWMCFCQSAYLELLISSAGGICDQACTDDTDREQLSTWYNSNCGGDFGASEHGMVTTEVVLSTSMSVSNIFSSTSVSGSMVTTSSPEVSTAAGSSQADLSTSTTVITSSTSSSPHSGTSSLGVTSSDSDTAVSSSTNPVIATSTSAADRSNIDPLIGSGVGRGAVSFALVSILFGLVVI